ncbi:ATP-dependent Clp protease ATP-binding subunit [Marmoricola sp. URHB0036]|uniref:ATP-dependent Clp protease ATP-binding subunit n=1 Tax=Marmoricola sp. URHB0036 TaxID=1298863 RepID=UPI00041D3B3E|nr:AAA family ATPase [Marmoricola sp. URHB0036]
MSAVAEVGQVISSVELRGDYTRRALEALDLAAAATGGTAGSGPGGLLRVLLKQERTITGPVFAELGTDLVALHAALSASAETDGLSLSSALRASEHEAKQLGDAYVSVEHLLVALAGYRDGVGEILGSFGIDRRSMLDAVLRVRGPVKVDDAEPELTYLDRQWRPEPVSAQLRRYSRDLTELAFRGKLDPVLGRDAEIERVVQVLGRRRKNNPVLIGDPGVGKTAIAEGLARRIVAGDVPAGLRNQRLVALDVGGLVAGASYRGEFEDRIKAILTDVGDAQGGIVLFIDELHTIVGAGAAEGAVDAGNLLKPMLARGELRTLGATTLDEYRRYVEKDAALERRFQPIHVDEPSAASAVEMLQGLRSGYEDHHGVRLTDAALVSAVSLSKRYIPDRFLPDKAIDLIDEAGSQLRIKLDRRADIDVDAGVVDDDDIASVVAAWTGIPVTRLQEAELEKLATMEDRLGEHVVGQAAAIARVSAALRNARAGLADPLRPLASLLLCGPSGVGKTHLAHVLADFMFGSDDALVQLDMSEYSERQAVARLIGAPPGYVGYEEGGQLTEAVRRRPYSVVLLDEIEQAHPDVHALLRQVMDQGSLADSQGRMVSFRNVVLAMTSSLVDPATVAQTFRADFVTRLDDVVPLQPLAETDVERLVGMQVESLAARLADRGVALRVTNEARAHVAHLGYDEDHGARLLTRVFQQQATTAVSRSVLSGDVARGDTVVVDVADGELVTSIVPSYPPHEETHS